MTILNCDCGYEIFIMDEEQADAWQCDQCGKWYDFFGCEVKPPQHTRNHGRALSDHDFK